MAASDASERRSAGGVGRRVRRSGRRLGPGRLGSARLTLGRRGTPTSRAWLAALTGATRTFRATGADLAALTTALARWQSDALAGPVRAFFRLTEPTDGADEDHWWLRFGLQATDEQSLVAEADEVWRATGALPGLGRAVSAPQETFLAELGKAARLYPALDDALRTARPDALGLDVAGAHRFLREAAPALATAGFGVQLPGWWSKPATRLGIKVTATPRTQPGWSAPVPESASAPSPTSATTWRSATTPSPPTR